MNQIFSCLADPTRRDMLQRVSNRELSVNELAAPYHISLAAVSKHLKLLEESGLIIRRQQGRKFYLRLNRDVLHQAKSYLDQYDASIIQRLDQPYQR